MGSAMPWDSSPRRPELKGNLGVHQSGKLGKRILEIKFNIMHVHVSVNSTFDVGQRGLNSDFLSESIFLA